MMKENIKTDDIPGLLNAFCEMVPVAFDYLPELDFLLKKKEISNTWASVYLEKVNTMIVVTYSVLDQQVQSQICEKSIGEKRLPCISIIEIVRLADPTYPIFNALKVVDGEFSLPLRNCAELMKKYGLLHIAKRK